MDDQKVPTLANGKICYIEIPTDNIKKSADFYKSVFAWNIRHNDNGDVSFDDTTGQVSGRWVTGRKAGVSEMIVYVMVDNMQKAIESVLGNGGKIAQPVGMDAPEITARFSDPYGNIFGLFQERS